MPSITSRVEGARTDWKAPNNVDLTGVFDGIWEDPQYSFWKRTAEGRPVDETRTSELALHDIPVETTHRLS